MAHALGLRAIAEGVEMQGAVDFLRAEGCNEIQGYHIARPMPAERVVDLILLHNKV
jgi:EAL domain-containing protein (putative c-di-GMP-specific phosphodiesterase class I)